MRSAALSLIICLSFLGPMSSAQEVVISEKQASFDGVRGRQDMGLTILFEDERFVYLLVSKPYSEPVVHVIDRDRLKLMRSIDNPLNKLKYDEKRQDFIKLGDMNYLAYVKHFDEDHKGLFLKTVKKNWIQGGKGSEIEIIQLEDAGHISFTVIKDPLARYIGVISLVADDYGRYTERLKVYNKDLELVQEKFYETKDKYNLALHVPNGVGIARTVSNFQSAQFDEKGNIIVKNGNGVVVFRADQEYDRWLYSVRSRNLSANYFADYMDFALNGDRLILSAAMIKDTTGNYEEWDMEEDQQILESEIGMLSVVISLETFDVLHRETHLYTEEELDSLPMRTGSFNSYGDRVYADEYFQDVELKVFSDGSYIRLANYQSRVQRVWFPSDISLQRFNAKGEYQWGRTISLGGELDKDFVYDNYRMGFSLGKSRNTHQLHLTDQYLYFLVSRAQAFMDEDERGRGFNLVALNLETGERREQVQKDDLVESYNFVPNRRSLDESDDNYLFLSSDGLRKIKVGTFVIEDPENEVSEDLDEENQEIETLEEALPEEG